MSRKPPERDIDEAELEIREPKDWAAGVTGVMVSAQRGFEQMGATRTVRTLRLLNQREGFDCPGCAWPERPGHRKAIEFCENGVKAVAEEATLRRVGPEFFAKHPVAELAGRTDYWLGQQGRLTHPMVLRPGATHYEPIAWSEAFGLIADELRALSSPHEAVFYTSGRTSNEAAFLYQLLVRCFGTNNLPDCSNMCHESSGAALTETIGVGKGSVSLDDLISADLILVVGQNPGTNHPRMLTALEEAKRDGARIVAVNPLPEAGLMRFKNPQRPSGVVGGGTPLADEFCQIRLGGDQAFFQALGHLLLAAEEAAPGTVMDREFVEKHTHGFAEWAEHVRAVDWAEVDAATGLPREQVARVGRMLAESERTVVCWAMGLTQHRHSVPTIREVVNLLLFRGMIGKPGAGVCPVRGHSNVQGDRTMGIWEKMPESFLAALEAEFGVEVPREHGFDTVEALRAMRDGRARVFLGLGGNFVAATPDTEVVEEALRSCSLTVQVSTKLNRSHVVHGRTALILPTLGRTDRDEQATGEQFVTVEDSMSTVHASRGRLRPASPHLLSEIAIITRLARALFGDDHPVPWADFERGYDLIRESIARVVPGCEDYNRKVRQPDGFILPHPPRDERRFPTATGKANFTVNPLYAPKVPHGRLLLQTMRSHDQYNTTIYGLDDRYRGVSGGRRVVFVHPDDLAELGFGDGELVDLVSEWARDGAARESGPTDTEGAAVVERRAERFRVVAYPTARGCAAAYFPEANALVPLDSTAEVSNTPTSKSVVVRLEPATAP
ncbi:oxidoreductase alpha (molybdopterin) subunit [Streptoalloteichus tenebrarius]|uniref:Oxidoreductase alpha (Molybdopterin) subunit n=1 Tax=Streptoalloteichus tenebrarius (strain ATCC 17920 / DSM 40477 / JCM 4838 / CBS 697.72 / NBRC 16177 / NCIMB 11028 / NRRL B-12390 / A12253. 1 / ISP 5477) TaxID=1933 RepID=A0ABT1HX59_STRSD|nr:FdhF/YdeP family oxidoreductase [Streptoalloteichus tenebrarius]MCP2260118.1 oxidoreductase alpha (molybdopterin) subunit [Streptoalloteichus tenebrarius]BFF00559.1 FdhF/YdeP family oxidoreductase [Streptoalloteichus tenebrarius]